MSATCTGSTGSTGSTDGLLDGSASPQRIVSLLPATTEIVVALGLIDRLVGRSFECTGSAEVLAVPAVTVDLLTHATTSRAIDEAVRAAATDGSSSSAVDIELLRRLAPDVILTQDLCEVCAIPAASLVDLEIPLVRTHPHTLAGVADMIIQVATALGVADRGERIAADMLARIARVREEVDGLPRRRVVVAEWIDPPFTAGHWIPEMVAAAGGDDLLGEAGGRSRETTWDAVRAAEPDLVVLAPCGLDAERANAEFSATGETLACPIVAIDADRLTAAPAPSLAEGVERLAELFHGRLA
jgi:iron complex transport system substrate-binding protein